MVERHAVSSLIVTTILTAGVSVAAAGRQPAAHSPQSRQIEARDGDTIVVAGDARVKIVRRRAAHVRTVFNPEQRWLILLARYAAEDGRTVHDGVDDAFLFREVAGVWPVAERWEGDATIETYFTAGESGGAAGWGLQLPSVLVQLFTRRDRPFGPSAAAAVLSYSGYGRSAARGAPFDDVERAGIAEATGALTVDPGLTPGVSGGVTMSATPTAGIVRNSSQGPIRKIHDVRPVWPEAARLANVHGMVVVQLTIAVDGSVADAQILRGIPLLDQAALDCVRLWRYEPVLVDGHAAPARIIETVSFP
jgi:TonB family protein